MKKLRVALVMLFALSMSLFLFACGGGEEENPGPGPGPGPDPGPGPSGGDDEYTIVSIDEIEGIHDLTDSDEEADYQAMLDDVVITIMNDYDEPIELGIDDCTVEGEVEFGVVGKYEITIMPTENNPDEIAETVSIRIDHDWEAQLDGSDKCAKDGAIRVNREEELTLHYGNFHVGTAASIPAAYSPETAVYNNGKSGDETIFAPFGNVNTKTASGDLTSAPVPTVTAGRLEKGMTITIRGVAKTAWDVWNAPDGQKAWQFPVIGIADRDLNNQNTNHPDYVGGTSVMVRGEGWVLYNGIGDTPSRMLASCAGGSGDAARPYANYGSFETDTAGSSNPVPSGYVNGQMPDPASDAWGNWWVYSFGTQSNSFDHYTNDTPVEISWYYREDGIIEMSYNVNYTSENNRLLTIYVKVPDNRAGYYDTILHGDYNDLTVTESSVITLRTPTNFYYEGLEDGAKTLYAENDSFDASSIKASMEFEQNPGVKESMAISSSQVYAYTGTKQYSELKADTAELEDASKWVAMSEHKLQKDYTIFKIEFARGGKTWRAFLNKDDGTLPFTIVENAIDSALGMDNVHGTDVRFANNGMVGTLDLSVAQAGAGYEMVLALSTANNAQHFVQALSDAQKTLFTGLDAGTEYKYIALRLNGALTTTSFSTDNVEVKSGATVIPHLVKLEGSDAYLVLALTSETATDDVIITGLQTTNIHLKLSALHGFGASSSIEKQPGWTLNNGGSLVVTYTVGEANKDAWSINYGGEQLSAEELKGWTGQAVPFGGGQITAYTAPSSDNGWKASFTITFPGTSAHEYAPIELSLLLNGQLELTDVIDYEFTLGASAEGDTGVAVVGENTYLSKNGTSLYVDKVLKLENIEDDDLQGTIVLNINKGDVENLSLLEIAYSSVNGNIVLDGDYEGVSAGATLVGTVNDNADVDAGAIIHFVIDLTVYEIEAGETFYFEYMPETTEPSSIYKVTGNVVSTQAVTSENLTLVLLTEGTCLVEGTAAYEVKIDDVVVFYASFHTFGGEHQWNEEGEGDTCELCGTTKEHKNAVFNQTLQNGETVRVVGTYNDATHNGMFNGVEPQIYLPVADGTWWRIRNDAYIVREAGSVGTFYNSTPYNTLNGVLNGENGDPITESSYCDAKKNGTFDITVSFANNVATVVYKLYRQGKDVPYSTFVGKIYDFNCDHIDVHFNLDTYQSAGIALVDGLEVYHGKIAPTAIQGVDETAISYKENSFESASAEYTTGMYFVPQDEDTIEEDYEGYGLVSVGGQAAKLTDALKTALGIPEGTSYEYYVAFTINFDKALATGLTATVLDAPYAVANVKTTESIEIILPLDGSKAAYTVDLRNLLASTLQSDIRIDVSELALSDVTAVVSGADQLTIAEGTVTITYSGDVQATDTLTVGEVTKALSELATETDLENGYSATVAIASGTTTLTLKKHAADLTKTIEGVEILLKRGESLLARNALEPALAVSGGTEIESTGWYAKAEGDKLTLFSANELGSDLNLTVNAGKKTEIALLAVYNVGVKLDVEGKPVFLNSNIITRTSKAVYSAGAEDHLIVLILDLSGLQIEAETPYGYASGETKYYTVNAERTIADANMDSGEKTDLRAATCVTEGVKGYKTTDESFYYGFETVATSGHSWVEKSGAQTEELKGYDKIYTCSNGCGAIKYEQNSDTLAITQTWGTGDPGKYDGWGAGGAANWEKFAKVEKYGVYMIEGLNLSNETFRWNMPALGVAPNEETEPQGLRLDNYAFETTLHGLHPQFSSPITDADTTKLDNTTITVTFDYSDGETIVITAKFVNSTDSLNKTVTVTLTPDDPAAVYTLWMHQDANKFTASSVYEIVPEGKEPSAPLTKHVHNWESSDKCSCGAIHPDHGTDPQHPHIKGEDQVHCSICGAVMEHEHTYNANYVCTECGNVDLETIKTLSVTDQNVGTGGFGGTGAWWGCASDNLATGAGDFLVKFTFSQGTSEGFTGCPEIIYTTAGEHGDGYLSYNPNDTTYWGGIMGTGGNAGTSASPATVTSNVFGTKPTASATVTYEVYVWRLGTTLVVSYNILNSSEVAWQQVLVVSNIETQALNIHINGYTNGYTDLHGYLGTITAKVVG